MLAEALLLVMHILSSCAGLIMLFSWGLFGSSLAGPIFVGGVAITASVFNCNCVFLKGVRCYELKEIRSDLGE